MPNEAMGDHNGVRTNTIFILRQLKSSAHKMSRVSKKNRDFFSFRTKKCSKTTLFQVFFQLRTENKMDAISHHVYQK